MKSLLLACAISAMAVGPALGQDAVDARLARIYSEYQRTEARPDIGVLVRLDQELREMFPRGIDYPDVPDGRDPVRTTSLRPGYEKLGLAPALYESELLTYSGKLLGDAHRANARSSFRRYTLYSTIFPEGEDAWRAPSLEAAQAYVREFPKGPFAAAAFWTMGALQSDLYNLQENAFPLQAEFADVFLENECFAPYLASVGSEKQMNAARTAAIEYFRRALALRPQGYHLREALSQLINREVDHQYFCPD